ncbi:hypothetical protein FACS1894214_2710 [Planctomycetales bacterium]|nr:hypothetical protein FACS1894214_2710 [Planctomycetales bacterium]
MRVLLFHKDSGWIVKQSILSFVAHDFQSVPVAFGIEYQMQDGTLWTFADTNKEDEESFFTGLKRSGLLTSSAQSVICGTNSVHCVPFLTKGVPETIADVSKIIISSDIGKFLYAAVFKPGRIESTDYSDPNFQENVAAIYGS